MALTKFSAATTSNGYNGPIPWTHIMNEPGLLVKFDVYEPESFSQASSHFQRLIISCEPEVLEDINLDILGPAAEQATAEATMSGRLYKTPECCIIVQCPCIAMRYPTDGDQVRRFQIRLAKREEFYEALSLLDIAKVPTTEAGALPNQKPSIARAPISGISHNDSQRTIQIPPIDQNTISQISTSSCARQRPPRAFLNHPTSVPRFVSQISNIPSIQQQHDSFQTPESRGGLNTRLPSQQLQAANGTGLVAPSSAPVNAGGQWEAQINLYAPRPSTAPMRPAKTERDLPPERELPFTTRPSTKQAAVPKSGENMLGTTRNAISVLSESITRQNKQDIILASIPDVDVPVKGNEIMSMDTSNFQRAMSAQKIDTQEILTKAQVRLARSSMHLRQVKDIAQTQLAPDDQPATTSQKKRRNLRCLQCRSARTKCERNAENFEGTCQPCQAAERQCSFVADVEFSSEDRQAERTVVQVQNSQEEVHSESHLPRRSLRRRRASLKADFTNDVLPKTPIPEMTKNSGATKQQDSRKHSTQIITPMIKPKRLKTPSISSHKRVPVTLPNTKSSTHSEIQDRLPVYKDKVHNKHLCELSNPPADPRSDVSTATAVTDDLNALVPVTPAQKFFKTTTIEQDKPLSDQAEAKLKSQEASNQRIDTDNTAPPYSPFTPSKPEFTFRADNTCISSFLGLHHSEQSVMLDQFFTNAIQDENFLQLCKVLENRYEPMLFPDKW